MGGPQPDSLEAERWLAYAREDFAHGELGATDFPRSAAWSFQQAAEKALKAVVIGNRRPVPRTHDVAFVLAELIEVFPDADALREDVLTLAEISPAIRYPGDWPELQPGDVARISAAASCILAWCERKLRGQNG